MEREQKRVASFLVLGVFFLLIEQLHLWAITYNLDEVWTLNNVKLEFGLVLGRYHVWTLVYRVILGRVWKNWLDWYGLRQY
jgi:hypothetical protein